MDLLDCRALNTLIEAVDEVGFHLLRFSVGCEDRAWKDYLYSVLAYGKKLDIHYRVVIERVTRFWLNASRRTMFLSQVYLAD